MKKMKKFLWIAAAVGAVSCMGKAGMALAGESIGAVEVESNDSFDEANEILTNVRYTGIEDSYYDYDYFHFTLDEPGSISVTTENLSSDSYSNHYVLFSEDEETRNTKEIGSGKKFRFPAGSYFIKIAPRSSSKEYAFKINYNPEGSGNYEVECNDSMETANKIEVNAAYTGNIQEYYGNDYYYVDVEESGEIKLQTEIVRQSSNRYTFTLLSEDGEKLDVIYSDSNPTAIGKAVMVQPGRYYIKVYGQSASADDYKVTLKYEKKTLIESVSLSSSKSSYVKGEKDTVHADILPSDASNKDLNWSSSDTSVVKVDSAGNITCVGEGKAYIKAAARDGSAIEGNLLITVAKVPATPEPTSTPKQEVKQTPEPKPTTTPKTEEEIVIPSVSNTDSDDEDSISSGDNLSEDWEGEESDDCTLERIVKSKGTWDKKFRSKCTDYVLTLGKRTSKVLITPMVSDETASYTINGESWKRVLVKLKKGEKVKLRIKVVAENEEDYMVYKVVVKRKW